MKKKLHLFFLLIISFTCLGQTRELSNSVNFDKNGVLLKSTLNDSLAYTINHSLTGTIEDTTHSLTGIQNYFRVEHPKAALPSILIAAAANSSYIIDVEAKLEGTGMVTADTFNINTGTPTLLELESYDAVFVFTDASVQNPEGLGNILGQYIDGGGAVVDANFTPYLRITGGFTTYELYSDALFNIGSNFGIGTILEPGDPIIDGVSTFDGGSSSYHTAGGTIAADAVVVAEYANGTPLIIKKDDVGPANAKRVFLNFYPPSSSARSDLWNANTDGAQLMVNALLWATRPIQLITRDIVIELDSNGNASITAEDIDNGSTANDGIDNLSIDISTFDCSNLGENTVTLMVTDASGNVASATATVTVIDGSEPEVITQDITANLKENGTVTILPVDVLSSVEDNCTASQDITLALDQDTFTAVGVYVVNLTSTDTSGNSITVEAEVNIDDTLSINDVDSNSDILLFPNPTSGDLFFEVSNNQVKTISIYDMNGRLVKTRRNLSLNVSDLSRGVYFAKVDSQNGKSLKVLRFIKK